MQLHSLFSFSAAVFDCDRLGFVCISRLRIAESRSEREDEAPCICVPPVMLTLAFGAGGTFREDCEEVGLRGDRESDTRGPAAEGGAFAVIDFAVIDASFVTRGT